MFAAILLLLRVGGWVVGWLGGWVVGLVGNKANLSPSSVRARVGAELGNNSVAKKQFFRTLPYEHMKYQPVPFGIKQYMNRSLWIYVRKPSV